MNICKAPRLRLFNIFFRDEMKSICIRLRAARQIIHLSHAFLPPRATPVFMDFHSCRPANKEIIYLYTHCVVLFLFARPLDAQSKTCCLLTHTHTHTIRSRKLFHKRLVQLHASYEYVFCVQFASRRTRTLVSASAYNNVG